ncbi:MAG: hypothetical protein JWQ35_224 [Bacteriovoracaceae bacterium]|nr:hypothetical protein [Bacteriovoracaceae bacterium]
MKTKSLFVELGNYLKAKRRQANISQAEVSKALGYTSAQFISNFERGLCAPPLNKLRILITLYNLPVRELTNLLMREQKKYIEFHLAEQSTRRGQKRSKA